MGLSKNCGGLGFRSLSGFNLALLGKHCWKFLLQPQSLIARVSKARYYPNQHFLQASKGGGVSFIWSGIHEAKEAMQKGFRWVLGDGETILTHRDPWLRVKENFCVENQDRNSIRTEKVSHYFRPNTKEWDEDRVRLDFNNSDATAILNVRIPQIHIEDRWAWNAAKDGMYSVKSAYHFWQSQNNINAQVQQLCGWKRLWQLPLPQKVKIFLWRFCKNTIPVRNLLRVRGVNVPILCPMCNHQDVEHKLHVFFDCIFASHCWQLIGMQLDMSDVHYAPSWLLNKLETDTTDNLIKIATVLWGIWVVRNKKVWENKVVSPRMAVEWSSKNINDWSNAMAQVQGMNVASQAPNQARQQNEIKWKPPQTGQLKYNVDASVYPGSSSFSIGMILRDHNGSFIRGKTMNFQGSVSVFEAEALGVYEAMMEVRNIEDHNVIIETDSLLVAQALQTGRKYQLEVGSTLEACQDILSSRNNLRVSHVRKLANRAAHLVARVPCSLNSYISFETPPHCVLETIMYESAEN